MASASNQKWVTDVTQYKVFDERIYLSTIKDLWNGEIIVYHISRSNDNPLVLETFKRHLKHKRRDWTDRSQRPGSQYTSHAYHDMLPKVGPKSACHAEAIVTTMPPWKLLLPFESRSSLSLSYPKHWRSTKAD